MAKLLKRIGFVYKMPKSVPAKAAAEVQRAFVETTLAPLMAAANDATPLYFVDATHPSYTAHPSHGWIRKGRTRELRSNHGRVRVNINGALRWPDREVVHREAEKITSAEMIKLFADPQARHPTATAISMLLDHARYNHSRQLKDYLACDGCRIQLIYLPPYAPNLNLSERFWWFVKNKTIYDTYYPTFAAFKAALDEFFASLPNHGEELRRLITDKFHFIGEPTAQPP